MHVATTCLKTGQSGIPAELTALDSETSLLLLFGDSRLIDHPALIQQVLDACPRSHVMGCSTAGEIHGCEISDDSLVVAAARFDHTALRTAQATVQAPTDSYTAGRTIAEQLTHSSLRGVFVLSDGLNVNGSELVKGLNDTLGEAVVVTGGLAGDGTDFKRTWVIKDRMPIGGYVTAIGFYGDHVKLGHGSKGGWDKFGPERLVTKSKGNILYELDGRPALQLYKEYLGDRAAGLPATGLLFPLAIRSSNTDGKALVRTILAVDEAAQSMTFAGDMPEGVLAQLMRANFDRLVQGASDAATLAVNSRDRFIGHTAALDTFQHIRSAISLLHNYLIRSKETSPILTGTLRKVNFVVCLIGFASICIPMAVNLHWKN